MMLGLILIFTVILIYTIFNSISNYKNTNKIDFYMLDLKNQYEHALKQKEEFSNNDNSNRN